MGYQNIKIYNGGLKDWKKSGYPVTVIEALPFFKVRYITPEELLEKINLAADCECREKGKPLLTLLDYRVERIERAQTTKSILTNCETIVVHLDDLLDAKIRQKIPEEGLVVLVCETGNRDKYAIRFLRKYGFSNIAALEFGMRGWIKKGFPVQ